jgi:hypothetical protein
MEGDSQGMLISDQQDVVVRPLAEGVAHGCEDGVTGKTDWQLLTAPAKATTCSLSKLGTRLAQCVGFPLYRTVQWTRDIPARGKQSTPTVSFCSRRGLRVN